MAIFTKTEKVIKEEIFTLQLTRQEVEVLKTVLGSVAGDGERSPRKITRELYYSIPNEYSMNKINHLVKNVLDFANYEENIHNVV